jgi:hypothetical protein
MDMTIDQPAPIPNLIVRVRADGMKVFQRQAREQLINQARVGRYSVATLAQINGIPAFLLERWLAGGKKKVSVKGKPIKNALATPMIPVKLKSSIPAALAPLVCEVVLARGSIKVQVDQSGLSQLVAALSV